MRSLRHKQTTIVALLFGGYAALYFCRADLSVHSGQRLIDIADLPERPRIRSAVAHDGTVRIEWEDEPQPVSFDLDWLASQARSDLRPRSANRCACTCPPNAICARRMTNILQS